ncbi:uncharacterized protein [Cicer arietinum]|uniref:Uncharacterized protein LOC101503488 n=1 Tax=Cicer arietinum TaxID=3827 RepID=A0A1S2Z447_CICAR|nr:uncharacterized protein LOC101503488 [Cicer arietinum]
MRPNPSNEEVLEKLKVLTEQVAFLVKTNKEKKLSDQLKREIQIESGNASCNIGLKSPPEGVSTCVLYLSSPTHRKVEKRTLYNTLEEVLHNTPIPVGHVKLSLVIVFEPNAPLHIPDNDGDMKHLGEAIDRGKSVAAPKISHPRLARFGSCLEIQAKKNMDSNDSRIISMEEAISGDGFLYEKLVCTRELSDIFSLLSLHKLSMFKLDSVNVKKYVVDILLRNKENDKLFLAPYNSGAHWVLFAINATSDVM